MTRLVRASLFLTLLALAPNAWAQPAAPERVVARPGETEVVLHWDRSDGATAYRVFRASGGGDAVQLGTTTDQHYVDRSITSQTDYTYSVTAFNSGGASGASEGADATPRPLTDDEFLDLVQALAFDYFWYEAPPETGLVRDRNLPGGASSTAAVGFGLTALGIGVENGWVTREEAVERTLVTLRTLWNTPQSDAASGTSGYKGFFYHFLDADTGLRQGQNELSTIDTALLMAGVLYAGEYFDGDGADETEIRTLATDLYERVDWAWSQAGGTSIRLGWFPESGFLPFRWIGYSEAMILYLMAYGSPTLPAVPDWGVWTSGYTTITAYGYRFVSFPPLFGHQYSHAWVDFRGIRDARMRALGWDYFENSRRATLAQREYAIDNPQSHPNYGPNEWGFTASDDPIDGYAVHGAPPADNDNGTITPTAPGGSVAFAPEEATAALREMYRLYPNSLWSHYGFRDAYNLRRAWFARDFLGIDQGPFVLMIENLRTDHVWDVMAEVESLQLGLERAGFEPVAVASAPSPEAQALDLRVGPNPASGASRFTFTLSAPVDVRVVVTDMLGREVVTVYDGPLAMGAHALSWMGSGAAPGAYAVTVWTDGTRAATQRIVRL